MSGPSGSTYGDELRREVAYRVRQRIDKLQVEQKLIDALCRLPTDVREFALDVCFFVAIGGDEGGFFVSPQSLNAGEPEPRWLVVLNSCWALDDFQSAVAHEIAHLWLGHPEADIHDDVERHENQSAELVREWGFTGIGSVPYGDRPA